jgi:CheY-like chemotaxis protein
VVDDNVDAAESVAMLLRLWGHEVWLAHDGPEALRATAAHRPWLAVGSIWLFRSPLREGMTDAEVSRILGAPNYNVGYVFSGKAPYPPVERYKHYPETADALGNRRAAPNHLPHEEW